MLAKAASLALNSFLENLLLRLALSLATVLTCLSAVAAEPPVAVLDRAVWPEALNTPVLFDVASRAEIMGFARELSDSETLTDVALGQRLDLHQLNTEEVNKLRKRLWQRLWENYDRAQQSCEQDASFCYAIDDVESLRREASTFQVANDSFYAKWLIPGKQFNVDYLNELLHMAALFPQISSEVARFNDDELTGDELNDRVFLLTFDGGPSLATGPTDWMTDYLRKQMMSATFFVLGNSVELRRDNQPDEDLPALYAGQCVGVQGWQYRSHSQWNDWKDSIQRSVALVRTQLPGSFVPLFRPPYGQRRADSGAYFAAQQLKVALWNIDAEDSQLTAAQSADRVMTLMLLWRRGMIAFHDVQDRAKTAVPAILQQTAESGIAWEQCHQFD